MSQEISINEFLREVQKAINKYGIDVVTNQLKKIKIYCGDTFESDVVDFIIQKTANHYIVDKNDILNSKKRGVISEARRMCFALVKEHLSFTDEEIGRYFGGRTRQYINQELTSLPINQDKLATKQETKFVDNFLYLTSEVLKFKNEYSTKENNIK